MNYRQCLTALAVSDILGECRRTDLRPAFGLTSPFPLLSYEGIVEEITQRQPREETLPQQVQQLRILREEHQSQMGLSWGRLSCLPPKKNS